MAFTYKSIGNTAAAVVSLLAVGTLCWWQRTPGPIDAPRPQDEAEIMTAILERHYAMGRVVWFGSPATASVSIVAYTNAPAVLATSDKTNSPYVRVAANSFCYWISTSYHPYMNGTITVYNATTTRLGPFGDLTIAASNGNFVGRILTDTTAKRWDGTGTNIPNTLTPTNGAYGTIYLSLAPSNAVIGVRMAVTNNPEIMFTNTVRLLPNAPRRLAFGLRTAFIGKNIAVHFSGWVPTKTNRLDEWQSLGDSYPSVSMYPYQLVAPPGAGAPGEGADILGDDNRSTGWIVPENSYMDSGDLSWFGSAIHSNIFGAPNQFWYKWSASYNSIYGTNWNEFANKWQERQQKVWTTYVSRATATWRTTTNYSASIVSTSVVSGVTNVVTNTLWSSTNYVNTSQYNTWITTGVWSSLGRECATMIMPFERDGIRTNRVDPNKYTPSLLKPIEPRPSYWSTNIYNDMARPLSMLQWIRDYRQPTTNIYWSFWYTNGVLYQQSSTTGFGVASPNAGSHISSRTVPFVLTNSQTWGTTVLYDFTNPIPFTVDNVLFQKTSLVDTNAPSAWTSGPSTIASVSTGALGSSGWWPLDPDALRTYLSELARTNIVGNSNITFSMSIPYDCYHVQFSALTNYLNHAPAR